MNEVRGISRVANRRRESATLSFARTRLDFNDFAFDDFAARLRLAVHPCDVPPLSVAGRSRVRPLL